MTDTDISADIGAQVRAVASAATQVGQKLAERQKNLARRGVPQDRIGTATRLQVTRGVSVRQGLANAAARTGGRGATPSPARTRHNDVDLGR
ncbi:MAG: hypothetical protein LBS56_10700 [Propionibacteriaceae bacterium]|jgi:hypothetical protein|nr:hypothetical protein [Propionibacteriaceae bacterium]